MAGARARHHLGLAAVARVGRHPLLPVLEVAILDYESDRTPHRTPEANPGDDADLITLDRHPPAAPITLLAAREVVIDVSEVDVETGGCAFDYGHQFGSVRFAGGKKTKHLCLFVRTGAL